MQAESFPKIVIYGASRQGGVVLCILHAQGHRVDGFVDDNTRLRGGTYKNLLIHGGFEWIRAEAKSGLAVFVAIGNNDIRVRLGMKVRELGVQVINAFHPSAVIMEDVQLGRGVLVCAGAVVVSGTSLQDDVVINTSATVDHDSLLEQGAYLAPGVHTAGCVVIRKGAFVGAGTVIGPGVTIGEGSVVGAGSLVLEDVPPKTLAYGRPAKAIKRIIDPLDWGRILAGKKPSNF